MRNEEIILLQQEVPQIDAFKNRLCMICKLKLSDARNSQQLFLVVKTLHDPMLYRPETIVASSCI